MLPFLSLDHHEEHVSKVVVAVIHHFTEEKLIKNVANNCNLSMYVFWSCRCVICSFCTYSRFFFSLLWTQVCNKVYRRGKKTELATASSIYFYTTAELSVNALCVYCIHWYVAALRVDWSTCAFHPTCSGFAPKETLAECNKAVSATEEKSGAV